MWLAFTEPRNRVLGVVICSRNEQLRRIGIWARIMGSSTESLLMLELISLRLIYADLVGVFTFLNGGFKGFLQDLGETCTMAFDFHVKRVGNDPLVETGKDNDVWPKLLPLVAEMVDMELVHVPHPTVMEINSIQRHELYRTRPAQVQETILCVFRLTAPNESPVRRELIAVTTRMIGEDPPSVAKRTFLRVPAPRAYDME